MRLIIGEFGVSLIEKENGGGMTPNNLFGVSLHVLCFIYLFLMK